MSTFTDKGELPHTWVSEEKIKSEAPIVIRYLERKNATDLLEILGLTNG